MRANVLRRSHAALLAAALLYALVALDAQRAAAPRAPLNVPTRSGGLELQIGRASCRERV